MLERAIGMVENLQRSASSQSQLARSFVLNIWSLPMDNDHKKTQSSHAVSLVRCIRGNWGGEKSGLERSLNT